MLLVNALALSVVAFYFEPKQSDDLYRHFLSIDAYRSYSYSAYAQAQYLSPLIVWKGILVFVSRLRSNHYLPAIIVLIDYIIFTYNYNTVSEKMNINRSVFLIYFLVHFSMLQFVSIFSGLRNVFCFFISGAILLRKILFDEKMISYIPIIILGMLIHPAILIPFFLYYASRLSFKHKLVYVVLAFWPIIIEAVLFFLRRLDTAYLNLIVRKLDDYITVRYPIDYRKLLVEFAFMIFVYMQLILLKNRKYHWPSWASKYTEFIFVMIIFMLSSFFCAYYLEERMMIFLGILYLPMLQLFRDLYRNSLWHFFIFLYLIIIVGWSAYGLVALLSHMKLLTMVFV